MHSGEPLPIYLKWVAIRYCQRGKGAGFSFGSLPSNCCVQSHRTQNANIRKKIKAKTQIKRLKRVKHMLIQVPRCC